MRSSKSILPRFPCTHHSRSAPGFGSLSGCSPVMESGHGSDTGDSRQQFPMPRRPCPAKHCRPPGNRSCLVNQNRLSRYAPPPSRTPAASTGWAGASALFRSGSARFLRSRPRKRISEFQMKSAPTCLRRHSLVTSAWATSRLTPWKSISSNSPCVRYRSCSRMPLFPVPLSRQQSQRQAGRESTKHKASLTV